jgi:hypothetical protein
MLDDAATQLVASRDQRDEQDRDGSSCPPPLHNKSQPEKHVEDPEVERVCSRQEHHYHIKDTVMERVVEEKENTLVNRIQRLKHDLP